MTGSGVSARPSTTPASRSLEEKEIGANSADGTYCSIDPDRAAGIYDTVKAVYDAQGVEIAADVTTLYDNKYCAGAPGR